MPFYDESFIHDDNQNQRRNKRSYRVYKNGLNPVKLIEGNDVIHVLEGKGAPAIKRNIRNVKHRGNKSNQLNSVSPSSCTKYKSPDLIVDHCPRICTLNTSNYYDIRNNNVLALSPCKSFDNLLLKEARKKEVFIEPHIRNGCSLQNLSNEENLKQYKSPLEEHFVVARRGDAKNSYSVIEARRRLAPRRYSRGTPTPGIGIYRQLNSEGSTRKALNENESPGEAGSGHRGSLRGANKLARRARSFKDDLIERINNMRSPGQHQQHLSTIRSHSPLSPKLRNMGAKTVTTEEGEVTPAKELERHVKEVKFGLKHFTDVISKRKLEMLADNGTIVFEFIANIHKAIKPYCGRSPSLVAAVKRLCAALSTLIRLCDEITALRARAEAGNEELDTSAAALSPDHVAEVVKGLTTAVEEVAAVAAQHMTRPALSPRPALVSPRTQRNSLPDIPLTPKEMSLLTGEGAEIGTSGVRASHSSESVLDAPDAPDSPPPKPARPNRKIELAPPLPPKRKSGNENSLLALSIDRLSLQSRSSGSLDSMLNVSNDEDRHMHESSNHDHVFITPPSSDFRASCSCNSTNEMRSSLESHESQMNNSHSHANHNRFSNESGFVSVGHSEISTESSFTSAFSSHHYSSHRDRLASITSDESETPPELPAKTRRNLRADVQQNFPSVEIRQSPACSLHGDARPHTLAEHTRPPPLPLKKKHIMAYMEMFGNCSHPPNSAPAPTDFRHSIHTYNLASAQHVAGGAITVQRHQQVQRSIAQSFTVQHFGTPPLSGSEDSVSMVSTAEPPALPPKMSKAKQLQFNSSNELLPPPSPRPSSHNSSVDENVLNNVKSESSGEEAAPPTEETAVDPSDIILQTDVSSWLVLKPTNKEESEVRGGHPDSLIVLATKATKDFAYQEAFLATYRTWVSPSGLVARLVRRAHHFAPRPHELRSTLSLLTRVVADLTMSDLDGPLMQEIMEFIYWLVEAEELAIAKALRQILVDKQKQLHFQQNNQRYEYETPCYGSVSLRRDTLLDFKATEIAEQMTILDAALFVRLTTAEVLLWHRDQSEESSPNLTRFTAHFNKMSYWARSRILEQDEAEKREKYANKFLKVMKALRKLNNFNSYLALLSALDSPPVRRLEWPRAVRDPLNVYCKLIDSSSSFRAYRQALAETQPPCIPYIGLVLQDLTFINIGNPDLLPDGSINFTKRWQQYHVMENMKKFHKEQYQLRKNERIQAMFNEFDDVLSEEAMWQISETIKPRPGRSKPPPAPAPPSAPAPAAAPSPAPVAAQTAA